jgi:hypothetical protein
VTKPNPTNARTLLTLREQQRQHWSTLIGALNGLAMTLVLGIWSLFTKEFLDHTSILTQVSSSPTDHAFAFSYIVLAAGLSSIVLAFWRWYVRYLDNSIVKLYPEIMTYEQILGASSDTGMENYLSNEKVVKNTLSGLSKDQKQELVKRFVRDKRIGRRGHLAFDIVVFILIFFSLMIAIINILNLAWLHQLSSLFSLVQFRVYPLLALGDMGCILIIFAFVIQCCVFCHFQKNPSKKYAEKIKNQLVGNIKIP